MLLTTVQSVDPLANSTDASAATDISATFDETINAGTATPQNFVVRSESRAGATSVSATDMTVTADPSSNFHAGELVRVTATAGLQGAATAVVPRVWEFRVAPSSGSAQFEDTGQVLGSNIGGTGKFADVDGDGDLDLHNGNVLWINDGSGVFADSGQNLGVGGEQPSFGDIDGDGDQDIIGSGTLRINNGSGIFSNGQNLGGGPTATSGDLDGDGDLDIVRGDTYGGNRIFLNNGTATFTDTGQSLATPGGTEMLLTGDLDGDGDLDIYEAINGGGNRVWFNDGAGNFTAGQTLGIFAGTKEIAIGDVDNDGDLDLLDGNNNEGTDTSVRVWVNDGTGVFTDSGQQMDTGTTTWAVRFGDMDGDNDLDIVIGNRTVPTTIWLNDGDGTFSDTGQRLNFPAGLDRRVYGMDVGDIDGDGDLDIFEGNVSPAGSRLWINQNTQPSVSLTVDNPSVGEDGGVAEVTATLSAVHTEIVTVELGFSGSATETDDYTASGNQIMIPIGNTTGSITITANDDLIDEPEETVIVDITSVTNADEAGAQQVTVTLQDDDEPIPVPDITLSVDEANIDENGGVATFTTNLSVVTTVPVTIDLAISGTAGAGDFNASDTQIIVAPGATAGSITVTAVDDGEDEPNETVVVDVANVVGGSELGVQQQTTTITDDDEPVMPDVNLSVDTTEIAEDGGVATFTLTLSEPTTVAVTIDLELTGSAEASDFTASATQVEIAPGATTGTITVTAIDDEVNEPDESVIVDVANVTNGNEAGEQQATTTILDDDVPPSFAVTSLAANESGFHIEFTGQIDASAINLFDTQNAGMGAADVTVVGASNGAVVGSLVMGEASATFIASGGALAADTYTVTLRSSEDAFKDTDGMLLDGDGDGTGGDDYVTDFTIDAIPEGAREIHLPDFVRGPGQAVNLPADETGIPISISDGENVRAIDLRISYDPALLEITSASAPAGGTVVLNNNTPGLAILVFFNSSSLPAGESTFITLEANVPVDNASEIYGAQQVLDVHGVIVGDGNDNEFPSVVDDALQLASFFSDVSGNGRVNAGDASQVARFAALIDAGFISSLNTDPSVVGDISGNGRINAADASLVARFAALIPVDQIPPIPAGVAVSGMPDRDLSPARPPSLLEPSTSRSNDAEPGLGLVEPLPIGGTHDGSLDYHSAIDQVIEDWDRRDATGEEDAISLEEAVDELLSP